MQPMTAAETTAFLQEGTRTAKVATVRADGRPHLAPVWFLLDGDDLLFTTWHTSVKAANLRRDNRVTIVVDDESPPFAFVQLEGTATISDDLAALRTWAEGIGGRYMGAEQAAAVGARNGVPGELLIRVTPSHIVARKGVAAEIGVFQLPKIVSHTHIKLRPAGVPSSPGSRNRYDIRVITAPGFPAKIPRRPQRKIRLGVRAGHSGSRRFNSNPNDTEFV